MPTFKTPPIDLEEKHVENALYHLVAKMLGRDAKNLDSLLRPAIHHDHCLHTQLTRSRTFDRCI
jgi:hypothetical protein